MNRRRSRGMKPDGESRGKGWRSWFKEESTSSSRSPSSLFGVVSHPTSGSPCEGRNQHSNQCWLLMGIQNCYFQSFFFFFFLLIGREAESQESSLMYNELPVNLQGKSLCCCCFFFLTCKMNAFQFCQQNKWIACHLTAHLPKRYLLAWKEARSGSPVAFVLQEVSPDEMVVPSGQFTSVRLCLWF